MAWFTSKDIYIAGMAAAVPQNKVDEEDYKARFNKKLVEKFIKSTGIHTSHQTLSKQTAGDLGCAAAENLLNKLQVDRSKIGVLLFVTLSPDYRKPATACVLHKRLGLSIDCAAMDVGHGCSGFVYGNQAMEAMLMTSDAEFGLLIFGETTSKLINKSEHNSMMFGDAGAAVLYAKRVGCSNRTLLRTDGERFKSLIVPAGGFRDLDATHQTFKCLDGTERTKYELFMDGMSVFVFSTNDVPKTITDYLLATKTQIADYDLVAFHQANIKILQILTKKFKLDPAKVPICLDRYGNTSSVSIPLVLCDYYGERSGKPEMVLACGFGVGLSWGVTSLQINPNTVLPIIETDEYYQEGCIDISTL